MFFLSIIFCTSISYPEKEIYKFRRIFRAHKCNLEKSFLKFNSQIVRQKNELTEYYTTTQKYVSYTNKGDIRYNFEHLLFKINSFSEKELLKLQKEGDTFLNVVEKWFEIHFDEYLKEKCDPLVCLRRNIELRDCDSFASSVNFEENMELCSEVEFYLKEKHERFIKNLDSKNEKIKKKYFEEKTDFSKRSFFEKIAVYFK